MVALFKDIIRVKTRVKTSVRGRILCTEFRHMRVKGKCQGQNIMHEGQMCIVILFRHMRVKGKRKVYVAGWICG